LDAEGRTDEVISSQNTVSLENNVELLSAYCGPAILFQRHEKEER
jgi:hypothetical protein